MPLEIEQRERITAWFNTALSDMMKGREDKSSRQQVTSALSILSGIRLSYAEYNSGDTLITSDIRFIFDNPDNLSTARLNTPALAEEAKKYLHRLCTECLKPEINLDNPGNIMLKTDEALGYYTAATSAVAASAPAIARTEETSEARMLNEHIAGAEAPAEADAARAAPRTIADYDPIERLPAIKPPILVAIHERAERSADMESGTTFNYKAIFLGDSHVGKTHFLQQISNDSFSPAFIATIGVDFKTYSTRLASGRTAKFQLWDTAGQERFRRISDSLFRGSDCVFIMAGTNESDKVAVNRWREACEEQLPGHRLYSLHYDESAVRLEACTPESFERAFAAEPVRGTTLQERGINLLNTVAEHLGRSLSAARAPSVLDGLSSMFRRTDSGTRVPDASAGAAPTEILASRHP